MIEFIQQLEHIDMQIFLFSMAFIVTFGIISC